MRARGWLSVLVVALLIVPAQAGCCSCAACGFTFRITGVVTPPGGTQLDFRMCVNGRCGEARVAVDEFGTLPSTAGTIHATWNGAGGVELTGQLHDACDGDRYQLEIRHPTTGELLGSLDRRVEYETNHPNGVLCPPSCDHIDLSF